jgi:hypothetical protein
MRLKSFLNESAISEARKKFPDFSDLGIKASDYNITPNDIPRAETIGGMNDLMTMFTKKKVAPVAGNRFKLGIKNGNLAIIWPAKGKMMMRVRGEKDPGYMDDVINVFKEAYKIYFQKTLKEDISAALSLGEPEVGQNYGTSAVKRKLETINAAISELGKKEQTDATEAQMADLEDKRDKWQNVDKETEPAETQDTRPAGSEPGEEEPPEGEEDAEADADAEAEVDVKAKEKEDKKKKKKKPGEENETE